MKRRGSAWRRTMSMDIANARARRGIVPDRVVAMDSGPPPAIRARGQLRERVMNRNERAYAAHLATRLGAGEIKHWAFEPEKLRLADNTFYTPDFRVVGVGGEVEFHEAKGMKRVRTEAGVVETYWCEEDAKKSIKVAAELHPYRFLIVWKGKDGWRSEEV